MISSFAKIAISFLIGLTIGILNFDYRLFVLFLAFSIPVFVYQKFAFKSILILLCTMITGNLYLISYSFSNNYDAIPNEISIAKAYFIIKEVNQHEANSTIEGTLLLKQSPIEIQISMHKPTLSFEVGDRLLLSRINLTKISPGDCPYIFDFDYLLTQKGIVYKAWVKNDQIEFIDHGSSLNSEVNQIRQHLKRFLREKVPLNYGLIMAICLGDKEDLSKDSKELFINNGIAHIMAVSGLHIGIVYMLIFQLLRFLRKEKSIIGILITVLLIWSFILITGFPISAVRSGIMISIYSIFLLLKRKGEKLHILLFSAIIILMIDPYQLIQVGFQLSFLALIGILYFTDFFLNYLNSRWILLNYFYSIVAVSLAVQITTLPLSIYYFHAFPLHFLITNLIAIPVAFLILMLFILGILFSPFDLLNELIFYLLESLIEFVKLILDQFSNFQFLFLQELYLFKSTMILYYALLFLLFGAVFIRSNLLIKCFFLFSCLLIVHVYSLKQFEDEEFIYLANQKGMSLLMKKGETIYLFQDQNEVNTKFFHPLLKKNLKVVSIQPNSEIKVGKKLIGYNLDAKHQKASKNQLLILDDQFDSKIKFLENKVYIVGKTWQTDFTKGIRISNNYRKI